MKTLKEIALFFLTIFVFGSAISIVASIGVGTVVSMITHEEKTCREHYDNDVPVDEATYGTFAGDKSCVSKYKEFIKEEKEVAEIKDDMQGK